MAQGRKLGVVGVAENVHGQAARCQPVCLVPGRGWQLRLCDSHVVANPATVPVGAQTPCCDERAGPGDEGRRPSPPDATAAVGPRSGRHGPAKQSAIVW